ncbi:hypothetical protein ACFOPQ_01140 [Deinococcus antarcticus]|uniref:Uncharacterized protein n=1 Tax=Deinococcus antarcticus TaxID=1298767 RepID=A0ABV8A274_9DEIO
MNWNLNIVQAYLRSWATKAIVATEQAAIDYYLQNGRKLQDKKDWALDYGVEQYRKATRNVPFLNSVTWDDELVRSQLSKTIDDLFTELDSRITQAAREVTDQPAPVTDAPELPSGEGEQ